MNRHTNLQELWRIQEVRRTVATTRRDIRARAAEAVRRVLISAHLYLADHLSAEGFHYRMRGKYLYRRSDGITHRRVFHTSDANLVDEFIALYIQFMSCRQRSQRGGTNTASLIQT